MRGGAGWWSVMATTGAAGVVCFQRGERASERARGPSCRRANQRCSRPPLPLSSLLPRRPRAHCRGSQLRRPPAAVGTRCGGSGGGSAPAMAPPATQHWTAAVVRDGSQLPPLQEGEHMTVGQGALLLRSVAARSTPAHLHNSRTHHQTTAATHRRRALCWWLQCAPRSCKAPSKRRLCAG